MGRRVKYALHPGPIMSRTDGQEHHISARALARLHRVPFEECIVWKEGYCWHDYAHLYPRYDGNYKPPTPKRNASLSNW
jgi:hypothetical protein